MRRGLVVFILMGFAALMSAQTLMYPGDLAIINVNADGTKNFDVVLFKPIAAGTVICFTDDAWINATQRFRGSEGILTYTAPSDLAAGSVINCPGTDGGSGFAKTSGSFNPSGSGDNIIVYQGTPDDPFFLYGTGWARGATVWEYSDVSSSYRSDIPPGLSVSEYTITSLGTVDNYCYNPTSPTTGTLTDLLTALATPANWTSHDTNAFSAITNEFTLTPTISTISTPSTISTLPDTHASLHLTSSLTLSGPLTCQSITVAPGGSLTLLPNSLLRVYGEITNQAGTSGIIIKSDETGSGALIHSCEGVEATVERFIGPNQWHFVSSPVADPGPITTLFGTVANHLIGIYYFDEPAGQWVSASGTDMIAGRGYNIFYSDEGRTVSFRGTLNSFRFRRWLQVTRGSGAGWNLLGNPFPCNISWGTADQADAPGWKNQATALEHKSIYITTGGSGEGTTFATYNGTSGIGVPDNGVGTIASGQGFWVRAAGGDSLGVGHFAKSPQTGNFKTGTRMDGSRRDGLLRDASLCVSTTALAESCRDGLLSVSTTALAKFRRDGLLSVSTPPADESGRDALLCVSTTPCEMPGRDGLLSVSTEPLPIARVSVTSRVTGKSDQVAIVYDARSEAGVDRFDSPKLSGTGLQMYLITQGKPLVIDSRPSPQTTPDSIPITLNIPEPGNYEIRLAHPSNITLSHFNTSTISPGVRMNAPLGTNVFFSLSFILEDRLLGVRHALVDNPVYAFSAGAGILEGRFVLRSYRGESVEMWKSDNVIGAVPWYAYSQGDELVFMFSKKPDHETNMRIIDCLGKVIVAFPVNGSGGQIRIPKPLVNGIYFVQLLSPDYPVLRILNY